MYSITEEPIAYLLTGTSGSIVIRAIASELV